ncbi:AEC family transporter [Marinilabilia rubra]|uniref:Transporter n=1 Tax=Marinilabilia rubra TaxID=2162893 RepID=A0A2U2B9Y8_9BACT|nr:AEC family transporter [Marinilabilia rubra]PWD99891.1 transporter [Marinilabilia rubra]
MHSQVIVEQIIIAGIIVLVGALGSWAKIINEQAKQSISKVVFNISLPLLIMTTFLEMDISRKILVDGFWALIFSLLAFLLMYTVGKLTSRLFNLPEKSAAVHEVHTMFGNIVFLGFPLIAALYPQKEGIFFATIFYMVTSALQWTYAVFRLKGEGNTTLRERIKPLLNPNTVAFLLGLIFFFLQLDFPDTLQTPLKSIGSITGPLALMYVGASLAGTKIKGILGRYDLYALSVNKLLLIPFLLLLIINFVVAQFQLELSEMAQTVIVLQAAMPCMSMIVIMAKNYNAADDRASENVFLTTVLSLFTLPLVYFLSTVVL